MSPYLFIFVLETSIFLSREEEEAFTEGSLPKVGLVWEWKFPICSLQMILTLFFSNASKDNLEHLSWVFMWFEAYLALNINLEKRDLVPGKDGPNLEQLKDVLDCRPLPFQPPTWAFL